MLKNAENSLSFILRISLSIFDCNAYSAILQIILCKNLVQTRVAIRKQKFPALKCYPRHSVCFRLRFIFRNPFLAGMSQYLI